LKSVKRSKTKKRKRREERRGKRPNEERLSLRADAPTGRNFDPEFRPAKLSPKHAIAR
jgi:hypothetical protein